MSGNDAHTGSHYHQKRLAAGDDVPLKPEAEGDQTVYVSNLDWSVDEAHLRRLFGEVDGMKDVRLVSDFLKRSKGYAYIDYEKSEQVNKAVEKLNGILVNKRAMFVARSLPTKPLFEERTIFVKNLSASTTESNVRDAFTSKGEILGIRMPVEESTGVHKGYAFVEFSTAASTDAALGLDGIEIDGQKVKIVRSIPMKDHRHQKAAARKDLPARSNQRQIVEGQLARSDPVKLAEKFPTTIYVKNLAFEVDEAKLREHFGNNGVQQVMICKNAQGRSRGFGFVEFANKDQAQDALAYNDTILCGREIWVSRSQRAITQKKTKPAGGAEESKEIIAKHSAKDEPQQIGVAQKETKPTGDVEESKEIDGKQSAKEESQQAVIAQKELKATGDVEESKETDATHSAMDESQQIVAGGLEESKELKAKGSAKDESSQQGSVPSSRKRKLDFESAAVNPKKIQAGRDSASRQFRSAKNAVNTIDTGSEGSLSVDEVVKPLSNADFRAMLLQSS